MKKTNKGFTLVELIIVIAVIGVLAAILIPVFSNVVNKANQKSAMSDARNAVSTITAEVTDGEGTTMPDSLMFAKKGGKVYAFAYTQTSGVEAFDEEGFTMLTNGANDQENFDNTVEAYVQELVSEGYAAAATTARSNLLMKAYRTINPAETRRNYAALTDDEKLQVMHSMIQNVSFDPDKFVLQFSYTPTQAFFADHEVVAPVAAGTELTVNGVEQPAGTTLQNAIDAATGINPIVRLYDDVTIDSFLNINKDITIDGNGHTIQANVTRLIRVTTDDVTLTVKNVTMHGSASNERGVQVDGGLHNVTINLVNSHFDGIMYYGINIQNNTENITLNMDGCYIKAWGALNIWGSSNVNVHVTNSVLHGLNDKSYNAEGWNNFATIVAEGDTTGRTDDHANDVTMIIEDSVVIAEVNGNGNRQGIVSFNNPSTNNTIKLLNCDLRSNDGSVDPDGNAIIVFAYDESNTFVNENYTFTTDLTTSNNARSADAIITTSTTYLDTDNGVYVHNLHYRY